MRAHIYSDDFERGEKRKRRQVYFRNYAHTHVPILFIFDHSPAYTARISHEPNTGRKDLFRFDHSYRLAKGSRQKRPQRGASGGGFPPSTNFHETLLQTQSFSNVLPVLEKLCPRTREKQMVYPHIDEELLWMSLIPCSFFYPSPLTYTIFLNVLNDVY